jgi:hypothetical protein
VPAKIKRSDKEWFRKVFDRYVGFMNANVLRIGKGNGYVTLRKGIALVNYLKNDLSGILNPKPPQDLRLRFLDLWTNSIRMGKR